MCDYTKCPHCQQKAYDQDLGCVACGFKEQPDCLDDILTSLRIAAHSDKHPMGAFFIRVKFEDGGESKEGTMNLTQFLDYFEKIGFDFSNHLFSVVTEDETYTVEEFVNLSHIEVLGKPELF